MAGESVIGALRVVLGADTAALDKGLRDSQSKLASFGSGMATAAAGVAAAMALVGVAVAAAVRNSINEADKLGKMSQKIGVPVEQLSALSLAAALSDVSMESLGKSVGKLSKTMVEAAAKPTSDAALAFKALGVSVTESNGKLRSSTDVISDIAGKFEGLKDGAGKTAVSMAIFGKSGADMIPLLNSGKAGLKEMTDEAAQLGLVIDKHTAKAAENFNDNLTRLGKVKDGIILKITVGMLPALENLSANMVRVAKDGDLLKATGEALGSAMTGLVSVVAHISLAWQRLGVEWAALRELLNTDIFSGKLSENLKKFNETGVETTRQFEALRATMATAHLADAFGNIATKATTAATGLKEFNYQALAGKNALDQFLSSQQKSIAAKTAELQTFGLEAGAMERKRFVLQALAVQTENQIRLTDAYRMKISETAFAIEQLNLKLEGQKLIQEVTPIWDQYTRAVDNNRLALKAAGATGEEIAASAGRTAEKYGMSWKQQVPSIVGSFAEVAQAFGKEGSKMAAAAKILGAVQALISAYAGAAEALKLPFPFNLAASAAVLAKGLALVATIKSASVPKMATGGSMAIGGTGGVDSQMVPVMMTPGERVHVEQNKYGESDSGGGVRTVNVSMPEYTSRDAVRVLLRTVEELVGDGLRINLRPA